MDNLKIQFLDPEKGNVENSFLSFGSVDVGANPFLTSPFDDIDNVVKANRSQNNHNDNKMERKGKSCKELNWKAAAVAAAATATPPTETEIAASAREE